MRRARQRQGMICAGRAPAVPDRPILIGSGLDIGNVSELLPLCDGAILGTALKVDGVTEGPVDRLRECGRWLLRRAARCSRRT